MTFPGLFGHGKGSIINVTQATNTYHMFPPVDSDVMGLGSAQAVTTVPLALKSLDT